MFNEHIEIMEGKEIKLIKIEENFLNKLIVFFTYDLYRLPYNSFVEFAEDFYMQLTEKKLKSFTLAIENHNINNKIDFDSKLNLKKFFDKIQKILNSPRVDINEISHENAFGLIDRKEKILIDKNDIETKKYEYFVKENLSDRYPSKIVRHENDFLIQQPLTKQHLIFFSNLKLNSKDFEFLLKIYNTKFLNTKFFGMSMGCFVFEIDKNKKKYYLDKFHNFCKSSKKNSILKITSYLQHNNRISLDTNNSRINSLLETSCLIFCHGSKKKKINTYNYIYKNINDKKIKQGNRYHLKLNFKTDFQFNSLNFFFSIATVEKASEKAIKTIKLFYPSTQILKINVCTFQGIFEKQDLFLYKVYETFEVDISEVKTKIKKITIIAFFEMGKHKRRFDFHYYEKMDKTLLTNYNADSVIKSQEKFCLFLNNFKKILQSDFLNFKTNINIFYYLFLNRTPDFSVINCSFIHKSTILTESYIEIVSYLFKNFQENNFEFLLQENYFKVSLKKFYCNNLKFLKESFYSLFEYKDQIILTNFQEINQENIKYEKNTYFLLKLKSNQNFNINLCILPDFENEDFCKDVFFNKKNEIILIFKDLITKKKETIFADSDQLIFDSSSKNLSLTEEHTSDDNNDVFENELISQDTINSISIVRILENLDFDEFYMLFFNIYPLQFDLKEKFFLDLLQNDIYYTNDFAKKCLADKDSSQPFQPLLFKKADLIEKTFLILFKELKDELIFRYMENPKKLLIIGFINNYTYDNSKIWRIVACLNHSPKLTNFSFSYLEGKYKIIKSF
ncbi:hypothetical protein GVAV_001089 [Gurleya vavrai]